MLRGIMIGNSKVVIQVEYELDGVKSVCYGEIDKTLIDNFCTRGEDFIWMENNGNITLINRESLISIKKLAVISSILLRPQITDYNRANPRTSMRS